MPIPMLTGSTLLISMIMICHATSLSIVLLLFLLEDNKILIAVIPLLHQEEERKKLWRRKALAHRLRVVVVGANKLLRHFHL